MTGQKVQKFQKVLTQPHLSRWQLQVSLKNCERDLTRFPKGISLTTLSLSLQSMFRGNQNSGFLGKYWNIRETRFPVENDEKSLDFGIFAFFPPFRWAADEIDTAVFTKKSLSSKLFKYVVFWGSGITNLQRLPSGKNQISGQITMDTTISCHVLTEGSHPSMLFHASCSLR